MHDSIVTIPPPGAPKGSLNEPGTLALNNGRWHVLERVEPALHDDGPRLVWRPVRFGLFGWRDRRHIDRIIEHLQVTR